MDSKRGEKTCARGAVRFNNSTNKSTTLTGGRFIRGNLRKEGKAGGLRHLGQKRGVIGG